jgi:XTP/dITP diphosphohydrolase
MKLVFATNNEHKISEIREMLSDKFILVSLDQIGCNDDIPETSDNLEGNASQKAHYIFEKYGLNCFADDTGLEVEALDMAPGVYSARYAGPQRNSEDNIEKLLNELDKIKNRKARFRTVISLIIDGQETLFEGIVNGNILEERKGGKGFGYDPVFQPEGYDLSFAEMDLNEKNKISHRGLAIAKLTSFLTNLEG